MKTSKRVVIVGASDRPDRYAHKALLALRDHGHDTVLVHPRLKQIEGQLVHASLGEIQGPVDTVTMYVGAASSAEMGPDLMALNPVRVIFNPGAENPELQGQLARAGILPEEACTLVLLATGQF